MDARPLQPPKSSCFVLDRDGGGRLRLSWHPPARRGRWLEVSFPGLWLFGWASGGFMLIWLIFQGRAQSDLFEILWLVGWAFGGLLVGRMVYAAVRKPRREQLTLGESELRYDADTARSPSEMSFSIVQPPAPAKPPPAVLRAEIEGVRLDREGERQRLALKLPRGSVEIGRKLREPEREWLAEVLRAWLRETANAAGGQVASPSPDPPDETEQGDLGELRDPPAETWIEIDRSEFDRWQFRWMPFSGRTIDWSRWGRLVRTFFSLCGCTVPLVIVGGLWLLIASNFGRGGGGWDLLFALAFLTPFVIVIALFWLSFAATLWFLLRRYRPETLTLTPSRLAYDPGHYLIGESSSSGKPREIPRPEMGRIKLERVGGRKRLTVDHGVERIEIGASPRAGAGVARRGPSALGSRKRRPSPHRGSRKGHDRQTSMGRPSTRPQQCCGARE